MLGDRDLLKQDSLVVKAWGEPHAFKRLVHHPLERGDEEE